MHKLKNTYYLIALVIGIASLYFFVNHEEVHYTFFGFAQNKETEINFGHPVTINKVYATTGKKVKAGDLLAEVTILEDENNLNDQAFEIEEIKSQNNAWAANKKKDITLLEQQKTLEINAIQARIRKLKLEIEQEKDLFSEVKSIQTENMLVKNKIIAVQELEQRKKLITEVFKSKVAKINSEITSVKNPLRKEIKKLKAQLSFKNNRKDSTILIKAPSDGIIGSVFCKENEHFSSYQTLISFYEPNPTVVKGFVHEEQLVNIKLNDTVMVQSFVADNNLKGVISGLGSRIVEIPERMRKIPEFKVYGREVIISIPPNNKFLQGEKVVLLKTTLTL